MPENISDVYPQLAGAPFSPGQMALEFRSANHANLTHGIVYDKDTDYGKFMWEALIKPMGEGYVFISGKGGVHVTAIQLVAGANGGYQMNGHVDRDAGGLSSINFQTVDEMRANEWAHISVHYDKTYLTSSINGVPCQTVVGSIDRRCTLQLDQVGFTGGSDHNNGQFRMACQRLWEGDVPVDAANGSVFRPAIVEMSGTSVYNTTRKVTARMVIDLRNGQTIDISGNGHNGYMYDTTPRNIGGDGIYSSIGIYTEPTGNRNPLLLPKWYIDPFVYSTNHAAPATPPVGALFYDSFGRRDVHYGIRPDPLQLGALEVGGNNWISSGYGILNGNAFVVSSSVTPALFDAGRQDVEVYMQRPIAFDTPIGCAYTMYLRYTDPNNWVRIEVDDGVTNSAQVRQCVAGVITTPGAVTAFNNGWTRLRATVVGSTINIYESNTLRGGPYTIDAGLTGTKVGFTFNSPLVRIADFVVFAA